MSELISIKDMPREAKIELLKELDYFSDGIYVMKDGKKRLKVVKVGIAYIPNIEKSKWCKEIIESRESNNGILVHCCYHKDKYKWEPMKIANDNSKPSMVSEFVTKEI